MLSFFTFQLEGLRYNPFGPYYKQECTEGTECSPIDHQPTFDAVVAAKEAMCKSENCTAFVQEILHEGERMYDAVTGGAIPNFEPDRTIVCGPEGYECLKSAKVYVIARNYLDMNVVCSANDGFEICSTGVYSFVTPLQVGVGLSCCDAAKHVVHELVGQGHAFPHLAPIPKVNRTVLMASKDHIRDDFLCRESVWESIRAQKNIDLDKAGKVSLEDKEVIGVIRNLEFFDKEDFDAFLTQDMCWLPMTMERPVLNEDPVCCTAGHVFWSRMIWSVTRNEFEEKCPLGRFGFDVACRPDSYIPDDGSFHQVSGVNCTS
jgi:hypothetical protein